MIVALRSEALIRRLETEKLKFLIAKLRREQFGQSSERSRLLVEQLELAIADVEESQRAAEAEADLAVPSAAVADVGRQNRSIRSRRPSLPDHLPVERIVYPAPCACATNQWPASVGFRSPKPCTPTDSARLGNPEPFRRLSARRNRLDGGDHPLAQVQRQGSGHGSPPCDPSSMEAYGDHARHDDRLSPTSSDTSASCRATGRPAVRRQSPVVSVTPWNDSSRPDGRSPAWAGAGPTGPTATPCGRAARARPYDGGHCRYLKSFTGLGRKYEVHTLEHALRLTPQHQFIRALSI